MRSLSIIALLLFVSSAPGQYLSEDEQVRDRKLFEATGVDFPRGMKFYKLPVVSQRLFILNSTHVYGIYPATFEGQNNINLQSPWETPGGLHWSPRRQWRNATAVYLPAPVELYMTTIDIKNSFNSFQKQRRQAWRFPDGTIFADMLVRIQGGKEWAFEIRLREKSGGKWNDDAAYRPIKSAAELPAGSTTHEKTWVNFPNLNTFGIGKATYNQHTVPPRTALPTRKFAISHINVTADDDESFVPRDYMSNMVQCASCHQQAGKPTSYAGTAIRGSDTVLSWHPYTMATVGSNARPEIDRRWPIKGE